MATNARSGLPQEGVCPGGVRDLVIRWWTVRRDELAVWSDARAIPPLAVWGGILCVAAMIVVRRQADAGSLRLANLPLALVGTAAAGLALAARALLARLERHPPAGWLRVTAAIAASAPVAALWFGTARRLPLGTTAWLAAVAGLAGWLAWLWNREFVEALLVSFIDSTNRRGTPHTGSIAQQVVPTNHSEQAVAESGSPEADGQVLLWLKRTATPGGTDCLQGAATADFAPGESVAALHIAFCPIFPRLPQWTCEVVDAPEVRIKGTAVYPYGCRLELKRAGESSAAGHVEVRFTATLEGSGARAA